MKRPSRRTVLTGVAGGVALLAGCVGDSSDAREEAESGVDGGGDDGSAGSGDDGAAGDGTGSEDGTASGAGSNETTSETSGGQPAALDGTGLAVQESVVPLSYDLDGLEADAVSGGVPKDGIPSIDDPSFGGVSTGDGNMDPGDPVFGVHVDGEARAYPQYILVSHEIVNDEINGEGIAVTYCPLTGTTLGFWRGDVEFGVSGMLVNSNLIMYDRETDSWWPQMLGTSVLGELKGWALPEFRVTWTTWGRWKEAHPETKVLTEDTGFARNYGSDPYGSYNPKELYYKTESTLFSPRFQNDDYHPKEVFIGARSRDGTVAFLKDGLRETPLSETTVGDVPYLAAYHESLDSAWLYRNPDDQSFTATGDGYEGPDGTVYSADELPLETVPTFDTMWFPWYGFFPETVVVE